MKFSYSLSKPLISIPMLAIQLLVLCNVSSLNITNEYLNHKCLHRQGKYNRGSKYEENLNNLVHDMYMDPFLKDFSHVTFNTPPTDSVTVILQCRGDSYGSKCRTCAATAFAEFRERCPRNKGGTIWYDQCLLDVNMIDYGIPRKTNYKSIFSMHNPNNVTEDTELFRKSTKHLLYQLLLKANKPALDSRFVNYAAGEKKLGTKKLYAMVQCIRDIADCRGCLKWSIEELFKNYDNKEGGRVLGTNCIVRYELYPFLMT